MQDDEQLDVELDALTSAVQDHTDALRLRDVGIVDRLLDEVLTEHGLTIPPARRREFALALLKARVRSLEVGVRRTRAEQAGNLGEDQSVTVDGLLDAYLIERKLGSKSEAEVRAAYRRFSAIVGGNKPAKDVTKADCRAYKSSLLAAPSNRSMSKDGKLSPVSVKKLLGIVATTFRYGVGQGYLDSNPLDGLTRVVRGNRGQTEKRLPYTSEDLKVIFLGMQSLKGAKTFLPLLSAYSGCRVEEGGGLRVKDVRRDEGVTYLDFTPHEARGLKTALSRRRVPLHPELVRNGFLDYVKTLPADGPLFPELKPGPHGKLTGAFSKWWARFTDDLGIPDPRKTFHSLRHGFKDACRRAGMPEEVHDALTGHSTGSVGRAYGLGVPLPVLAEWIGKVKYLDGTLHADPSAGAQSGHAR